MPIMPIKNIRHIKIPKVVKPIQPIIDPDALQPAAYAPNVIQEEIILKRGGKFIVNQGYDETASVSVAQGATQTLMTVTVPAGSDQSLLITHFGNDLSDVAAWSLYRWQMTIDDIPVKSYYDIRSQLGYTSQMRRVGVDILVNGGQTLRVKAIGDAVIPGQPYNVLVSLIGVYGNYDYQKG